MGDARRREAREAAFEARERGRSGSLPDFVIVGAQKGGTTSLYRLLTRHPLVERAATKEVHFFDELFEKGLGWYCSRFPAPRTVAGRETLTGEATPYYLFHPDVPGRMELTIPSARLIALLRDPIERAYSHWRHETRLGTEEMAFGEAVEAEEERMRGAELGGFAHKHYSYLARGRYAEQLARFGGPLREGRMLVLASEDLFCEPVRVFEDVMQFLGLPKWDPPARALERRNVGGEADLMDPALRRRLKRYFTPHNQRLWEMLGRNLGW